MLEVGLTLGLTGSSQVSCNCLQTEFFTPSQTKFLDLPLCVWVVTDARLSSLVICYRVVCICCRILNSMTAVVVIDSASPSPSQCSVPSLDWPICVFRRQWTHGTLWRTPFTAPTRSTASTHTVQLRYVPMEYRPRIPQWLPVGRYLSRAHETKFYSLCIWYMTAIAW